MRVKSQLAQLSALANRTSLRKYRQLNDNIVIAVRNSGGTEVYGI